MELVIKRQLTTQRLGCAKYGLLSHSINVSIVIANVICRLIMSSQHCCNSMQNMWKRIQCSNRKGCIFLKTAMTLTGRGGARIVLKLALAFLSLFFYSPSSPIPCVKDTEFDLKPARLITGLLFSVDTSVISNCYHFGSTEILLHAVSAQWYEFT